MSSSEGRARETRGAYRTSSRSVSPRAFRGTCRSSRRPARWASETISSQELADYTHVNSTQIRRDLSGFGKFGKRGVGYNIDSLVSQIRKILHTSGQHNIALFGAGHLGTAIATSDIFADHGFRVVAVFDVDPAKVGTKIGDLDVRHYHELSDVVKDQEIVVAVLAVPGRRRRGWRTTSSRLASRSSSITPKLCSTCRLRSPFTRRVRRSTFSTRSTSTSPDAWTSIWTALERVRELDGLHRRTGGGVRNP